jgi:hypothetical protein
MGSINFEEIPSAKGGGEGQDKWALFAKEFFAALNIEIEKGPDRGADSGADLVIVEKRKGILSHGQQRWLVSCKHFAQSKKSVSIRDEPDILGRVRTFKADGFIGFYSTVPSGELNRTLQSCKKEINILVYDGAQIERGLLNIPELKQVFKRYYPKSFKEYNKILNTPNKISGSLVGLHCTYCHKDLLKSRDGIVAFAEQLTPENKIHIPDMYWACTGKCDRAKEIAFTKEDQITTWEDISDLIIPMVFMKWMITAMNGIRDGSLVFDDKAYEKFREFTFALAQLVVRETTDKEKESLQSLQDIPFFMGGLGGWGPPQ